MFITRHLRFRSSHTIGQIKHVNYCHHEAASCWAAALGVGHNTLSFSRELPAQAPSGRGVTHREFDCINVGPKVGSEGFCYFSVYFAPIDTECTYRVSQYR